MTFDPLPVTLSNASVPLDLKIFNPDILTLDTPPRIDSTPSLPVGNVCPSATTQRRFMVFLARNGTLNDYGFSAKTIKKAAECGAIPRGFSVRFLFPPQRTVQCKDCANLCLMENSVVPLWNTFVPRLLNLESFYRAPLKKRNQGHVSLSKVPFVMRVRDFKIVRNSVMRKSSFRRIKPQRENILSKLTLHPLPDNSILLIRNGLNALIQNTNLHPMVVEIKTPSPEQCRKIKKEYIDNKQMLVRQLAAADQIPSLSAADRLNAIETGNLPDGYPYSCHHMVPRILGGTNALHNLCYLDNSLHKHVHKLIHVYEEYLTGAPPAIRGRRLFVVLPMTADFDGPELRIVKDRFTIVRPEEILCLTPRRKITHHIQPGQTNVPTDILERN